MKGHVVRASVAPAMGEGVRGHLRIIGLVPVVAPSESVQPQRHIRRQKHQAKEQQEKVSRTLRHHILTKVAHSMSCAVCNEKCAVCSVQREM
jgi:hypothetical protein